MGKRRTKEQVEWCENYMRVTGFEPLMDDFKSGAETFEQAARKSVNWFESWANETMRNIDHYPETQP